ncbi:MAG: 1-acyl-sn-glycerol-3-phosphate acyltransferase [Acidimicrobiia bacterium]
MTPTNASKRVPIARRAFLAWAHSGVSLVYRHVDVTARSNVPEDRPAILAANHSNALADVAVIVAKMPKFPRVLAAASWWKWPPVRLLFRLGGVVPVYRRREGETEQNAASFEACHAALATGAHLAIFPEGEMNLDPALLPLKTGAARIALGAAADSEVAGIVIVPVGMVYDDRARFRSDLEIHFGEPIEVDEWVDLYRTDPTKAVRAVTDLVADRLAEATVNHGSRDEAGTIDRAAAFALADRRRGVPPESRYARRNELRRAIASSVAIAGGESSAEYRRLKAAVAAHTADLEALGVSAPRDFRTLSPASGVERVSTDVELAVLTVPAVLGLVANAPTIAVIALATSLVRNEGWKATTIGVLGTFLSPVLWAAELVVLARRIGRRRALVLTTAGAIGGAAALAWRERFRRRQRITWRDEASRDHPALLARAETSRAELRERVAALVGAGVAADLR